MREYEIRMESKHHIDDPLRVRGCAEDLVLAVLERLQPGL
jgi:hypothetical protein